MVEWRIKETYAQEDHLVLTHGITGARWVLGWLWRMNWDTILILTMTTFGRLASVSLLVGVSWVAIKLASLDFPTATYTTCLRLTIAAFTTCQKRRLIPGVEMVFQNLGKNVTAVHQRNAKYGILVVNRMTVD